MEVTMPAAAITDHIDVAQIALYAFWLFFAGLIFYLRREDRREGYPLIGEDGRVEDPGVIFMPDKKTFTLMSGYTATAPRGPEDPRLVKELKAKPAEPWLGAPLVPTGNPMLDGVGPAAYSLRADTPEMNHEGLPKIVPLRVANDFYIEQRSADPRGMRVVAADGRIAGTVRDVWVDRSEYMVRYLEVEVANAGRTVLVPYPLTQVSKRRGRVVVSSILARQFADVPGVKNPNEVTRLEEDKISAYYTGGKLYAVPSRAEPLL
jgi:photosynthetic reaction center H subunit